MIFSKGQQKRTCVETPNFKLDLDLKPIGFLGSCFAIEIQKRINGAKLSSWVNPGGTLYNPYSIAQRVERLLSLKPFELSELYKTDSEDYIHWLFDTHLTDTNPDELILKLNKLATDFKLDWQNSSTLVVTLGTTWVYQFKETNEIVSNCHKIPASHFTKSLLSQNEINQSIQNLKLMAKGKTIIWTLSPIRHWKDGAQANSLSKALLRVCLEANLDPNNLYFPSYEMIMDEYRDHHHYNHDAIHLNSETIDCIADRFIESLNSTQIKERLRKGMQLQKLEAHRPLNEQKKGLHLSKIQALKSDLGII